MNRWNHEQTHWRTTKSVRLEDVEMTKFIVDLWLDGYDSEEEHDVACKEFIYEQLNFSASSVTVTEIKENENDDI